MRADRANSTSVVREVLFDPRHQEAAIGITHPDARTVNPLSERPDGPEPLCLGAPQRLDTYVMLVSEKERSYRDAGT